MLTSFDQPVVLENSRVKLIPLRTTHLEELYEVAAEKELWKWMPICMNTKDDLRQYLFTAMDEYQAKVSLPFLIIDQPSGQVAGTTRYMAMVPAHKRLEIGHTWISGRFQGSGLNKAVKYEMLKYAFETMKVNRVELKTDILNEKSKKAIMKLGAKEEGVFRYHMVCGERVRHTVYFSIVQPEWERIRKKVFGEFC